MELDEYDIEYRAKLMASPDVRRYDTLREYLTKGGDRDIDVCGEVYDFACAVCCLPIIITEEGEKRWGKVLDCPIVVCNKTAFGVILDTEIVDKDEDSEIGETGRFLVSLAGYCSETDYDKWFKIPEESED